MSDSGAQQTFQPLIQIRGLRVSAARTLKRAKQKAKFLLGQRDLHSLTTAPAVVVMCHRHGHLPAPTVDQLLEPDPELYLAGGPLAPDHCDCAGVCECGEDE